MRSLLLILMFLAVSCNGGGSGSSSSTPAPGYQFDSRLKDATWIKFISAVGQVLTLEAVIFNDGFFSVIRYTKDVTNGANIFLSEISNKSYSFEMIGIDEMRGTNNMNPADVIDLAHSEVLANQQIQICIDNVCGQYNKYLPGHL